MTGIFKAYDIRGQYPDELDETIAEKIGRAFARLMDRGTIAVGRDCRLSSPGLAEAFIRGFTGAGGSVTDFGMVSTPYLYYAIIKGRFDGGAMITASHLPKETNGIKLCRDNAIPLSGDSGLPALQQMVEEIRRQEPVVPRGAYRKGDRLGSYLDMVAGSVDLARPLRIAIDAGDGMAGQEIQDLSSRVPGISIVTANLEPDGNFPHHGANPFVSEATRELEILVRSSGSDLGVAFDGDADRCIFVDEMGERIPADLVTALIATGLLAREPGAKILYDLRSSRVVAETISDHGGKAVRCRVGHAFIKEQMREENALFAGELSGHYYFRDTGFCDNGLFAMIQTLNILSRHDGPFSRLVAPLKKYSSTGEINIRISNSDAIFSALRAAFPGAKTDTLDGLTLEYPSWWFNLRASNTEPVIRLNLEAQDAASRDMRKKEVLGVIRNADPSMTIAAE